MQLAVLAPSWLPAGSVPLELLLDDEELAPELPPDELAPELPLLLEELLVLASVVLASVPASLASPMHVKLVVLHCLEAQSSFTKQPPTGTHLPDTAPQAPERQTVLPLVASQVEPAPLA